MQRKRIRRSVHSSKQPQWRTLTFRLNSAGPKEPMWIPNCLDWTQAAWLLALFINSCLDCCGGFWPQDQELYCSQNRHACSPRKSLITKRETSNAGLALTQMNNTEISYFLFKTSIIRGGQSTLQVSRPGWMIKYINSFSSLLRYLIHFLQQFVRIILCASKRRAWNLSSRIRREETHARSGATWQGDALACCARALQPTPLYHNL